MKMIKVVLGMYNKKLNVEFIKKVNKKKRKKSNVNYIYKI